MFTRLLLYLLITIGGAIGVCAAIVLDSRDQMASDPSAMAWVGFLPFLFPIFVLKSALVTTPVYLAIELFLFVRKRIRTR